MELDELVDENGGLCKVQVRIIANIFEIYILFLAITYYWRYWPFWLYDQSDAQKTAAKYLKLLYHAFISKGAFESKGEALRR